jgi:hypothetical protein
MVTYSRAAMMARSWRQPRRPSWVVDPADENSAQPPAAVASFDLLRAVERLS